MSAPPPPRPTQERIELELVDGKQVWPAAERDYISSEHCEGHLAVCCTGFSTVCALSTARPARSASLAQHAGGA